MFDLRKFQSKAAQLICDRYAYFAGHTNRPMKGPIPRPFFQALSAITGAGKTPILAQAVSLIRNSLSAEPIVLWMSKARSVVQQTYNNFSDGKYSSLIDSFKVYMISDVPADVLNDGSSPLLLLTTTALFNDKEQGDGSRNIYKPSQDKGGDKSLWRRLVERTDNGHRRPLIIVYDEGHNLSEQQTDILSELEAEAYLLASATMTLPQSFSQSVVHNIALWTDETDDDSRFAELKAVDEHGHRQVELFTTTTVNSGAVVEAQLVKRAIQFDGSTAPMERSVDELFERLALLQQAVDTRGLGVTPKAIYVCQTNVNDDGNKDDPSAPFKLRNAPPIRIWRYLVETKKVDPKKVAIYADLKFGKDTKPDTVNLFARGDDDFDEFQDGDFQHIIFNLSLQEGWDDPACYLAYIDKSMGSNLAVEQVIGRALRQPGAEHYENPLLNTAHFFLRVDNKSVFADSLERVQKKLGSEGSPIVITSSFSTGRKPVAEEVKPKARRKVSLHSVYVNKEEAAAKVAEIEAKFPHFKEGTQDTTGVAELTTVHLDLRAGAQATVNPDWRSDGAANPVRIRWLLNNAIRVHTTQALKITSLNDPRFDVRIQTGSNAEALVRKTAEEITAAYYEYSTLSYERKDEFKFEPMRVLTVSAKSFKNAIYPKYGNLSKEELAFANALDKAKVTWHRNPVAGGFKIPLLTPGPTDNFYPDFLAWKGDLVFALDTKGKHLLTDALDRKLMDIYEGDKRRLFVRFILKGKQSKWGEKGTGPGYTVWRTKNHEPQGFPVDSIEKAVVECFKV